MEKLKRSQEMNLTSLALSNFIRHKNATSKSNVEINYSIRLKLILDSACRKLARSLCDFIISRYYSK